MKYTKRLFKYKKVYDTRGSAELFVRAMRENAVFQYKNCDDYKRILDEASFNPYNISDMRDLIRMPFLPTVYFKHHHLYSVPLRKQLIKATSSGTGGAMSKIGFDFQSLNRGKSMVIGLGRYHKLWSLKPVNYLIFGYQPTKTNQTAISKTAYGFTFFAPAVRRTFALELSENGYRLSWERVLAALEQYAKSKRPMRTIGFPAFTYFLLRDLKEKGIRYQMPKGSKITLGGGWKQFYAEQVDKREFYALVREVLGIEEENVVEFFGAVEHPIMYTDCPYHHFHVPVYSRVVIRNPDDFSPVPNGQIGLVNLMTPMMRSAPLLSVMTDDLGVLHDEPCPCGICSPWFEIIGRVGIADIVTCAAGAEQYLKE